MDWLIIGNPHIAPSAKEHWDMLTASSRVFVGLGLGTDPTLKSAMESGNGLHFLWHNCTLPFLKGSKNIGRGQDLSNGDIGEDY